MIGKGEKKVNELEVKINNEFEEKILDLNEWRDFRYNKRRIEIIF